MEQIDDVFRFGEFITFLSTIHVTCGLGVGFIFLLSMLNDHGQKLHEEAETNQELGTFNPITYTLRVLLVIGAGLILFIAAVAALVTFGEDG